MNSYSVGNKRLLSAFVALAMLLCLLPSTALAAKPTEVYVGDTCVSDEGGGYWTYDTSDSPISLLTQDGADSSNYVVRYEAGSGKLTLNGITVPNGMQGCHNNAAIYADGDLTINLIGTNNSVTGPNEGEAEAPSYGVYAKGYLEVQGSGTLIATGANLGASSSYGVYAEYGNITVSEGSLIGKGGKVGGNNDNNYCSYSYGVYAKYGDIIVSGGSLTGEGGNATTNNDETVAESYGVYADEGNITVSGGSLTGTAGDASGGFLNQSCGVKVHDDENKEIKLTGGVITAKGSSDAVNKQPNFGGSSTWYKWKANTDTTTEPTGGYTVSSDTQFNRDDTPAKYLRIIPKAAPIITTQTLPDGIVGTLYSQTLVADQTCTWSATGLPAGLTLDSTSGLLSGTPTRAGKYTFSVSATRSGYADTRIYTLTVALTATVSDVTVSGTTGTAITNTDVTLTLAGDAFVQIAENADVSSWFNLPTNLSAKTKTAVAAGAATATVTIYGTPSAESSAAMTITIPADRLQSGIAAAVTANANAKYNITPPPKYAVTLNLTLDDSAYTGQTITIQKDSETPYTLTGAGGVYTCEAPSGEYTIYKDNVSTGKTLTINGTNTNATLDFFTVSFNANGGTPTPADQIVPKDSKITAPSGIAKTGCALDGWYKESTFINKWNFDADTVAGTNMLYAKWLITDKAIMSYSISGVNGDIKETEGTIDLTLPYGTDVTALVATFTASENATVTVGGTGQASGTTANDFTSPVIYTVTAEAGGSAKNYTVTVTVTPFVAVTDITMTNAASVQVNTDLALSGTVTPTNAINKTIVWSLDNANGTGATVSSDGVFRATTAGTAKVMATIADGTAVGIDYTQAFDITVTDAPPQTYLVTVTGGSGGGNYIEGAMVTITANAPASGKRFKEWTGADGLTFVDSTSKTTATAKFTMPASAVSVTATYEDISATTYAVTLNLTLDGSAYTGQAITIQESTGTLYTLTEATGGAYTNSAVPNGTYTIYKGGVSTGITVTVNGVNGSATLDFFTVSFNANGGTPTPADQVVVKDGYASTPAAMTRGTDVFGGWYSNLALTSEWTFTSSKVTATTPLYAKWMPASPTFVPVTGLTFNGTLSVAINTDLTLAATVVPSNATNKTIEWSLDSANGTGATVSSSGVFRATMAGTATVKAQIINGASATTNYEKTFSITVTAEPTPPSMGETYITHDVSHFEQDSSSTRGTVYNNTDTSAADIWLTGAGFSPDDRLITETLFSGSDYNAFIALANGGEVIGTYDISLMSGKKTSDSPMYLSFDLAANYAGQTFTLVHKLSDGIYEYFYATADVNGDLKFGPMFSLSPFMLVKGTLTQTDAQISVPDATTLPPQTGDNISGLWIGIAMLALLALGGAAYGMIKRKQIQ